MELKVGLKFKKYYNDKNINNIDSCEVRGIIDDSVIVLWCEKNATPLREKREFYLMIYKEDFDFNVEKGVYVPLAIDTDKLSCSHIDLIGDIELIKRDKVRKWTKRNGLD